MPITTLLRCAGIAAASVLANTLHAQPLAHVTWLASPPPDCVDAASVERTIEARLGRRVFSSEPEAVQIQAAFVDESTHKVVRLEIRSAAGEHLGGRELTAASCEELSSSLPVVIAVLLDELPTPEPAAVPEPRPAVVPAPQAREPARASGFAWRLRLAGLVQTSVTSELAPAVGGALQLSAAGPGPFEVLAWGDALLQTSTGGSPAALVRSGSLGLALCASGRLIGQLSAGGCLGGGALRLHVRGTGFVTDAPDARWLGVWRALARLEYAVLAWLSVRLETGLGAPWVRPNYGFEGSDGAKQVVFRPWLSWLSQIGLYVAWP